MTDCCETPDTNKSHEFGTPVFGVSVQCNASLTCSPAEGPQSPVRWTPHTYIATTNKRRHQVTGSARFQWRSRGNVLADHSSPLPEGRVIKLQLQRFDQQHAADQARQHHGQQRYDRHCTASKTPRKRETNQKCRRVGKEPFQLQHRGERAQANIQVKRQKATASEQG
jgi:hypothetical protein